MELVSVIIPAYNAEKTIKSSVESVLLQTYSNLEIIIVNDGSSDNTDNICRKLAQIDSRIKIISIANGGVSNARNVGLDFARGEYISFLDSDDRMEKFMLEKMALAMHENNANIACCGYHIISSEQKILFSKVPNSLGNSINNEFDKIETLQEYACFNALWNKMFLTSIIKTHHIQMDRSISMGEDLLFVIDYMRHMTGTIAIIPEALYRYTLSNNGLQATYRDTDYLRLNQLNYIKRLYIEKGYPLDGLYNEILRTIYTSILVDSGSYDKINTILSSDLCVELKEKKIRCRGKYKVLHLLIRLGNAKLILWSICLFRMLKKLSGKSYEWQG